MILYVPFKMGGKLFFGKFIGIVANHLYLYKDGIMITRPSDRLEFSHAARIPKNE